VTKLSDVITEAFNYFEKNGFEHEAEVSEWLRKIEAAARESMEPPLEVDRRLRDHFKRIFERTLKGLTAHQGITRFTVQNIHPELRALLDRRIMASVNLIKLNRDEMINSTLRRFAGWLSSIPDVDRQKFERAKLREKLYKPLSSLPWAERRVFIDQGHKLVSNINATVAEGGGAIAAIWRSHWRQENYDYRESHKERDGKVYMMRDSWAVKEGLVKKGPLPWSDEITQPAEEPFCRCNFSYLYHLRQLPIDRLTEKGSAALKAAA
jgi:hypothetical protein